MVALLIILITSIVLGFAGFPANLLVVGSLVTLAAVWVIRFGPDIPATFRRRDIPWYRRW